MKDKAEEIAEGNVDADVGDEGVVHDDLHVGEAAEDAGADGL